MIGNKRLIEIIIGNDGPPFNEEDIPKLFESFFTKGKKRGTGLGLASAHKIIGLHNGKLSARNIQNEKGVEFVIELPASEKKELHNMEILPKNIKETLFVGLTEEAGEIDRLIKTLKDKKQFFKILLLEDEALYRASVKNTIGKSEDLNKIVTIYDVQTVDDGLMLLKTGQITHAIIDIDLNDLQNGFDFLKEVNEKYPGLLCLVHTNRSLEEDKEKAWALGAKGFVPKPLNIEHFVKFLSGLDLNKKRTGEQERQTSVNQKPKKNFFRILVADDDFLIREANKTAISNYLKDKIEHEIIAVENGNLAFEKLKNNDIDVVFSDVNMGDESIDGFELTEKINKIKPDIKIFIVSCSSSREGEKPAQDAGASGYIEAPLNANKVEKVLSQIL